MADFGSFNFGGLSFPLTSSTSNSLLRDSDPAIFYALDYFSAMLAHHIGARLVAEATACGATDITSAVASAVPYDVAPRLVTSQFKFPLLAVFRINDKFSLKTTTWRHEESRWGVHYVLPPMRDDQRERLEPILHAAAVVIHNRTEQGHDPAYSSDAEVWKLAGLEQIGVTQGSFGAFQKTEDLVLPAWMGELSVFEREEPETDFQAIAGVDANQDLAQADGSATVPDIVDFKSDVPVPGPTTG